MLYSLVIRNAGHGSSSLGDSSDGTTTVECPLSSARSRNSSSHITDQRNGTLFSEIADRLRNKNLGESLREIRKCLTSLKKEKELVLLTRKLNEIEAEKVVGFPDSQGSVFLKNPRGSAYPKTNCSRIKTYFVTCKSLFRCKLCYVSEFHLSLQAYFSHTPRYSPERRG